MRNFKWWRLQLIAAIAVAAPAQEHLKFGQPACKGPVLDKDFFIVCHDTDRKIPIWVGYALSKENVSKVVASRKGVQFRADRSVTRGQRAENSDYAFSGFDKGHMAPAADFARSPSAIRATFVLSNAVPQKHGVNAGEWSRLEAAVRSMAESCGNVWVFSGPVFVGGKPMKTIGKNRVAVPTHTYKVALCVHAEGSKEMFGFVVPNLDKPRGTIRDHTFSVSMVEQMTGLDFFAALPTEEQRRLEGSATALPNQ
jgi:endonuclease G